ncbi:hypothetical protein [Vibrio sp. AND4]|uniref:hypothetical protein n=1 Tax=Vibrio sp. AND4 TaxID=314289 RepID=UPI00015F3003|nr:hypothetical protein [Vibrio sp. AND4]EDP60726.1 hypothetical protein AND4_07399 [Vibrio sp. AND4]
MSGRYDLGSLDYHETMSNIESIAAKTHAETISNAKASTKQAAEVAYHETSKQVSHIAGASNESTNEGASSTASDNT